MDSCQANVFTKMLKEVSEYVEWEYDQGGDVQSSIENLKMPTIPLPLDPYEKMASKGEIWLCEKAIDLVTKGQALHSKRTRRNCSLCYGTRASKDRLTKLTILRNQKVGKTIVTLLFHLSSKMIDQGGSRSSVIWCVSLLH